MSDPVTPRSICILRLSAIGDCCHIVPIVRTLQHAYPQVAITWVIGRVEARLLQLLPGIEFIIIDKRSLRAGAIALRQAVRGRRFDVLLHMQTAFRASLYSLLISARRRIGFDWARARELQWLFSNERIAAGRNEHVLDTYVGFVEALGVTERRLEWRLPIPAEAAAWARRQIPDGVRTLVVSACSSRRARNWRVERYAAVIDHAVRRHGLQVLLCGSPAAYERDMAARIENRVTVPVRNIVGTDTLPQLLALLQRATVLLAPDSGPAHMATMVGTPVIGVGATTRSARSGPYLSRQWCVDRYAEAALRFRGRPASELPWTETIEDEGAMDLVETQAVCARLDELMASPLLR
jgi:heptosyltransferase I